MSYSLLTEAFLVLAVSTFWKMYCHILWWFLFNDRHHIRYYYPFTIVHLVSLRTFNILKTVSHMKALQLQNIFPKPECSTEDLKTLSQMAKLQYGELGKRQQPLLLPLLLASFMVKMWEMIYKEFWQDNYQKCWLTKGNTTEFWFLPCNFNHLNFLEI